MDFEMDDDEIVSIFESAFDETGGSFLGDSGYDDY